MKPSTTFFYSACALPFICFGIGYWCMNTWYPVPELTTPNLIGNQIQHIIPELSRQQLNIRLIAEKEDLDLEPGTVVRQTPAAGQKIKAKQSIFVVLSKKPAPQIMPSLSGKNEQEITQITKQLEAPVHVVYAPSTKPAGTCIGHIPEAGKPLTGNTITIYLALSQEIPVVMPDLRGRTLQEIEELKMLFPVIIEPIQNSIHTYNIPTYTHQIIDQRPLAGSIITLHPNKPLHIQVLV